MLLIYRHIVGKLTECIPCLKTWGLSLPFPKFSSAFTTFFEEIGNTLLI